MHDELARERRNRERAGPDARNREAQRRVAPLIEKIADVASRVAPNSCAIGLKNAPKLYATPNRVKHAMNPAATVSHARAESRASPAAIASPITAAEFTRLP